MGGCASKPKEFDDKRPVEAPVTPEKPQLDTFTQENTNGGESQIDKPLVDLSEPEKEAQQAEASSEPKAAAAEHAVSSEPKDATETTAKETEEDVKLAPQNVVDGKNVDKTTVPAAAASAAKEVEDEKPIASPSKEQAKADDAPLVSL